jgi:hypothetical protein
MPQKKTTKRVSPKDVSTRTNRRRLVGEWGVVLSGALPKTPLTLPQPAPFDSLIAVIYRVSFEELQSNGIGKFWFYAASNHGGNTTGRIATAKVETGFGDPSLTPPLLSGIYKINADGATGWMRFPPIAQNYTRFSFVITNNARELFFLLTEITPVDKIDPNPPVAPPPPAPPPKWNNPAVFWGVAKREKM